MKKHYKLDLGIIGTSMWIAVILGILKITNIIDISIWWVLSPIFISIGMTVVTMCILFTIVINNLELNVEDDEDDEEPVNDE